MIPTALLVIAAVAVQDTLSPAARRVLADVRYLAADSLEGRGVGTRGLERAASHVARELARAGFRPGAPDGTFFQPFTISADAPAVMHTNLGGAAVRNVVGVLPGASPALRGQVVIVGAHYDHLGPGGFGSLDPDSTGRVHNGADDNASGTAALLEIARRLGRRRPARTIVLVAFSAEEIGALGSNHYVKNATPGPMDSVYAMINLDMVGRLRAEKLLALGAATAVEFPALLDSLNRARGASRFDLRASGDGWGPSDHASFYAARRPVLHFFTDLHDDYHRTTDDWDKINAQGTARVAEYVSDVAWALANRPAPLTFVDVPRPQVAAGGQGYGAYLGTIPDMSESPGGVRISGVRAGSPAEQAGLKGGDIITGIGDRKVANLVDMTEALRSHQPGDTVAITVKRDGADVRTTAVLGRRGT
jgi:acetylornithine deacetylase/succinyl-diaminopimelate desuccinylase-like protein